MTASEEQQAAAGLRYDPPQLSAVGEVDLCHDAFGDPEDPAMLLVMGLTSSWSTGRRTSAGSWPQRASA